MLFSFSEPPSSIRDHYEKVDDNDTDIREALGDFTDLPAAIQGINEEKFAAYGFFIGICDPNTGRVRQQSNLFFEKEREFKLFSGVPLKPVAPIYVYKKSTSYQDVVQKTFFTTHRNWLLSSITEIILSKKDQRIVFVCDTESRTVTLSTPVFQALGSPQEEVPLLNIAPPKTCLDFASLVIELLHCSTASNTLRVFEKYPEIISSLSIDQHRKLYDIFPEEFIKIPQHVWRMFRTIDVSKGYTKLKDY